MKRRKPYNLYRGDCRRGMRKLLDASVDSTVCDPPYGLHFMGKGWDHGVPGVEFWSEALRVAKPGSYLIAFGGTRTFHRLMCAIEDAGWEIRDTLGWLYGTGFPKSLDVMKGIDKAAGIDVNADDYTPSDAAKQWEGWGTALKPAWEPIVMARKPLEGTVAANVQEYGTGAINVDACRIPTPEGRPLLEIDAKPSANGSVYAGRQRAGSGFDGGSKAAGTTTEGRWPANVIHDGSDGVLEVFPETRKAGNLSPSSMGPRNTPVAYELPRKYENPAISGDNGGSAARFFYCAKTSKSERNDGLSDQPIKVGGGLNATVAGDSRTGRVTMQQNNHPTVKPVVLMRYLCRLVTPPKGVVLDPFMGSGSTGVAAVGEGFRFRGCELDPEYMATARRRLARAVSKRGVWSVVD